MIQRIFNLFLLISTTFCFAQLSVIKNATSYPFWIYQPKENCEIEKKPLIIFLHGKSLSGTDINKVKRYGVLQAIEKGREIPAIVIAPQVASGAWNPDLVLEVLEYAKKNFPVDETKIYVCGMSLGGYGTLHFAGKYPDKITAAVAICGGGFEKDALNLSKNPLWIIHGEKDKAVPISESKKIVSAVQKILPNAPLEFTFIKDGTHSSVERYFHQDEFYNWLFSKSK